jgi:hypothetical protein
MSRRGRHGRHQPIGPGGRPRPGAPATERPAAPVEARTPARPDASPVIAEAAVAEAAVGEEADSTFPPQVAPEPRVAGEGMLASVEPKVIEQAPSAHSAPPARREPAPQPFAGQPARPGGEGDDFRPSCTVAQLRRFIKSRPWIPMHELRRRFGIYGGDDDVSPIRVGEHTLFIGLPPAEGRLMAELLGGGDVGYELSLDPVTPIVVGVYPMRPVPRG